MSGVIAQVLADTKVISREANQHVYHELLDLQTLTKDPTLASPYLQASANSVVAANGGSTGNLTITMNFPKAGVKVTTGNITFNAAVATVQSSIDSALSGEVIGATYNAGDVAASGAGLISGNALTLTANGATVNGYQMIVTTANVDMDVAAPSVTEGVVGTGNRPAEAALFHLDVLRPSGTLPYQGQVAVPSDYELGDNPFSVSPALQAALAHDAIVNEDETIGVAIRAALPSVAND